MTPLAYSVMKQILAFPERSPYRSEMLSTMADVHFFECTAVQEAAEGLMFDFANRPDEIGTLAFLPAPKTWIEYKGRHEGHRLAFLLQERKTSRGWKYADIDFYHEGPWEKWEHSIGTFDLSDVLKLDKAIAWHSEMAGLSLDDRRSGPRVNVVPDFATREHASTIIYSLYAFLALINSPRVVGRAQHSPHRLLRKEIASKKRSLGSFQLRDWTEIKLQINRHPEATSDAGESCLTGEKALHFCRSHLRVRFGKLEIVSAHWRGNPAVGIAQSRYVVAGNRSAA